MAVDSLKKIPMSLIMVYDCVMTPLESSMMAVWVHIVRHCLRLVHTEYRTLANPHRNILDGDLLWKYLHLSVTERNDLARRIGTTCDQVSFTVIKYNIYKLYYYVVLLRIIMANIKFNRFSIFPKLIYVTNAWQLKSTVV